MKFGKLKKTVLLFLTTTVLAAAFLEGCGPNVTQSNAEEPETEQESSERSETEQKKEETETLEDEPEAVQQSDTIRWINASYAILTEINGLDYNIFGSMKRTLANELMQQRSLEAYWDVTDRQSADETLDWALTEGHRTGFAENMKYLAEAGLGEVEAQQREAFMLENFDVNEEEARNYVSEFQMYEQYGEHAIDGWDYCRAMSLLSFYYIAGFYTEEEALDKSLEIAKQIQPLFVSWDEMVDSYLRGYEYWAEESSEERRHIYEELKSRDDNPYAVDYNVTLEKTW